MDRNTFGKKTSNTQRPRVDRFVAPRASLTDLRRPPSCCNTNIDAFDIWYNKNMQQKKYASYLDGAFGLEAVKVNRASQNDDCFVQPWPCVPRKKSHLSSADSILDLPSYSYAPFPELLDWSNDNVLVAALGTNYHKWSWRTQSLMSQGYTQYEIHCCKFDPRGEVLLLGTAAQVVEVHNNVVTKFTGGNCCRCMKLDDQFCSITALDWSNTGNSFVSGCSRGMLVSFSRDARHISWRRATEGAILFVRVSPDARYVAVVAVNCPTVFLMTWPHLQLYATLRSDWTIKAINWHPWRSALLGVGAVISNSHTHIALLDAPTQRWRDTKLGTSEHTVDTMLFSPKTGELVLSLWNSERGYSDPKACTRLVVMSDASTVVDQWGEGRTGFDRVRTMVFSPDGTKLATATEDEDLVIWNFLPEDSKKKKKTKLRRFSMIPEMLDNATDGYSLR